MSVSEWVDKTTRGHLHNGILFGDRKENFTLCNNMDGPGEHMLSEISQSEKDKYHVISLICGI